jgi:hypothetical protein
VGPDGVVLDPPVLHQHPSFHEGVEARVPQLMGM